MKASQLRARYRRILFFFAGVALNFILWEVVLTHLGLRRLARRTRPTRYRRVAREFRKLAIRMGGVMIKVGQFLSSRLDVLPSDITQELAGLQDEVPPEKFEDIRRLAEEEFGVPLAEKYESFEEQPLAAASLGQVHRARLCVQDPRGNFCDVVVKIQRPSIDQLIEVDLAALRQVGGWLQHYPPIAKRVDAPALVEEFAAITRAEVDYLAEGKNAERFAENFKDVLRVHVPRVVWSTTTRKVLTLEDVYAIKITDYEAITSAGIDRAEVAHDLLDTYLKQIFEDGFFHADPHPGNLFITPLADKAADGRTDWLLTFVDFGMVGQVPDTLRMGMREMLMAMATQDAARIIRSFQSLHVLLPGTDLKQLEQMSASMFDMFWGKSVDELRQLNPEQMFAFADRFRDLLYNLPFQLPENLLMLGRTVSILSGMCSGLEPDFNLFAQLTPYAAKLVSEEGGSNWQVWLNEAGNILKELVAMPSKVGRILSQIERGELTVQVPSVNRELAYLERAVNGLAASVVLASFLLGGVLIYNAGHVRMAEALFGGALLVLLWLLVLNRRRPRRFRP
jgi:predicted unusual protein kinase regulating ubiquinone biosynthesis (AarF/ABC1/UbiB family)